MEVAIIDTNGKIVFAKKLSGEKMGHIKTSLNIKNLEKGIYMLRLTNGKDTCIGKFVKQ